MGQSGLAKVDLVIDEAGQQVQAFAVVPGGFFRGVGDGRVGAVEQIRTHGENAVSLDEQVRRFDAAFMDQGGTGEEVGHVSGLAGWMSNRRICSTPRKASRKMLRLILEVPNSRSMKVMGTSAMGKPSLRALYFISI